LVRKLFVKKKNCLIKNYEEKKVIPLFGPPSRAGKAMTSAGDVFDESLVRSPF